MNILFPIFHWTCIFLVPLLCWNIHVDFSNWATGFSAMLFSSHSKFIFILFSLFSHFLLCFKSESESVIIFWKDVPIKNFVYVRNFPHVVAGTWEPQITSQDQITFLIQVWLKISSLVKITIFLFF